MKRYYQLKEGKKGAYTLRENTYRRIRYLIADYPYFKKMLAEGAGKAELRETAFGYTLQGPSLQFVKYVEAIEKARQEIPEIYADDVKCSHGATIGRLNEEEQFYMRSRGISLEDAKVLQMISFIAPILENIPEADREDVTVQFEEAVRNIVRNS